jgi:hypothetical protein
MTIEQDMVTAIKTVTPRVFADFADFNTQRPFVTFQRLGGKSYNYLDATAPNIRHCMFQVNVWAATRAESDSLARQIEDALRASSLFTAQPDGEPAATFDDDATDLRGTRQDFSVWQNR